MKIEDGKIKPCSTCLKARQKAKDLMATLSGKKVAGRQLIECEHGDVTTLARIITEVSHEDLGGLMGLKVYVSGKWLLDVEKAEPIRALGKIKKISDIR